jgi:exodeoxyribonuclease-3
MKIITYNVNGIRAAVKKGFLDWLKSENPDIICIQETKAQNDQIPVFEFTELGYHTYISSAQKKGYSGVAILSKTPAKNFEIGIGEEKFDSEGRLIKLDFENFIIVNAYHPSGSSGDVRQDFKMEWLDEFYKFSNKLKDNSPNLIMCGDYNICHREIDIHDPVRNKNNSGFLPEEREWMTKYLDSGFIDSFRFINPEPHNYSWWSYRANARANNKGWRIDYNMVADNLKENIKNAEILSDVYHSDHCPVKLEIEL